MERTIRVTGKGNISVKPDMIRLILDLEDHREYYEETLRLSAERVELLKDCFEKLGFQRKDLKTLSFEIDTKYENYQAKDKSWKQRFVGYEFKHRLKIEFDANNERLGKVLYALSKLSIAPEIRIVYTVKDPEANKNLLLGNAIKDSKEKATVLTEAAGVKLGEIQLIDYSWGEIEFTSHPMDRMLRPMALEEDCCLASESYDIDIEPDDIEVSDTVTVVWGIV